MVTVNTSTHGLEDPRSCRVGNIGEIKYLQGTNFSRQFTIGSRLATMAAR
jgi:hypothetical protein